MADYHDSKLSVNGRGIAISWYYLWGAKHVPLDAVKAVERMHLSLLGGQWRIWGSGNRHCRGARAGPGVIDPATAARALGPIPDESGRNILGPQRATIDRWH
jgi:hypothetical protein